jgi:KilA-N domain
MDSSIIRSWNGKIIRQREDGYLSATDMCQSFEGRERKDFFDWYRLKSTQEYLFALSEDLGIPVTGIPVTYQGDTEIRKTLPLIEVFQGGISIKQGSWIHPLVATDLAQWLSPKFRIQVNKWIQELLLNGYVSIKDIPNPEPRYLPMIEQAEKAVSVAERYKVVFGTINPQIEQHLKDLIGNTLIETNRMLEGDRLQHELWMGVVNFAEVELEYSVSPKGEYRASALGTWIRYYYPGLSDRQERRFCNETQRDIFVYPIHKVGAELAEAVHAFFADPAPGTKLRLDGAFKRSK